METIKSYTDIPQSKRLAEFLPLESADMFYDGVQDLYKEKVYNIPINGSSITVRTGHIITEKGVKANLLLPCWSLSALLNILAKQDFIIKSSERNNEYQYNIDIPSRHCKIWFSSLLDAAFEMIIWLKENNKL